MLQDRVAIEDLLVRYCRHLDEMDLDALAALFTPDCVVEYGPGRLMTSHGSAQLRSSLERMWRWRRTAHHLANVEIDFGAGGDDAVARSAVTAWHERPDGSTGTVLGRYTDHVRRLPAGWRIARRRMEMVGNDAGFDVNLYRFERQAPPDGWTPPSPADL
jgi:ketosteroid isomerase-like protein